MGYQNDERPEDLSLLTTDIQADLVDLRQDIDALDNGGRTGTVKKRLLRALEFISVSMRQVRVKTDKLLKK